MKGQHEDKVENIRMLLQEGKGMTEILQMTNMSAEKFKSIQSKLNEKYKKEYNDRIK